VIRLLTYVNAARRPRWGRSSVDAVPNISPLASPAVYIKRIIPLIELRPGELRFVQAADRRSG
jgi:hypothetical protein